MHNKIVEVLEGLSIDLGFMEYTGNAKEYIIFNIYNEEETNHCDDNNMSDTYYISLNYWFNSLENINKYKKIKELMKSNKFIFNGSKDLKDGSYYGKNMDFIYVNFEKEGVLNG